MRGQSERKRQDEPYPFGYPPRGPTKIMEGSSTLCSKAAQRLGQSEDLAPAVPDQIGRTDGRQNRKVIISCAVTERSHSACHVLPITLVNREGGR